MPSKNTSVLAARVKDKTVITLKDVSCDTGVTVPRIIDLFARYIEMGLIEIADEETMIFEAGDSDIDLSALERIAERKKKTPQQMLDFLVESYERMG